MSNEDKMEIINLNIFEILDNVNDSLLGGKGKKEKESLRKEK